MIATSHLFCSVAVPSEHSQDSADGVGVQLFPPTGKSKDITEREWTAIGTGGCWAGLAWKSVWTRVVFLPAPLSPAGIFPEGLKVQHAARREEEQHTAQCGAPEASALIIWHGKARMSPGSVSSALRRPLLTRGGYALWAGLNIICLLALPQVVNKQTPMKPSMPVIPTSISAEAARGTRSVTEGICLGPCCRRAGDTGRASHPATAGTIPQVSCGLWPMVCSPHTSPCAEVINVTEGSSSALSHLTGDSSLSPCPARLP